MHFQKHFQDSFRIYHLRTLNAQICVANCEAHMQIFYQISENIDLAYMYIFPEGEKKNLKNPLLQSNKNLCGCWICIF